jgi:hypothetical protein
MPFEITAADRQFLGRNSPRSSIESLPENTNQYIKNMIASETRMRAPNDIALQMRTYTRAIKGFTELSIPGSIEYLRIPIRRLVAEKKNDVLLSRLKHSPLHFARKPSSRLSRRRDVSGFLNEDRTRGGVWTFEELARVDRRVDDNGLIVLAGENLGRYINPDRISQRIETLAQRIGLNPNNVGELTNRRLLKLLGRDGWWQEVADDPERAYQRVANTPAGLTALASEVILSGSTVFANSILSRYASASSSSIPFDDVDRELLRRFDSNIDITNDLVLGTVESIENRYIANGYNNYNFYDGDNIYEYVLERAYAGGYALHALAKRNLENLCSFILEPIMYKLNLRVHDVELVDGRTAAGETIGNLGFAVAFNGYSSSMALKHIKNIVDSQSVVYGLIAPLDRDRVLITMPFVHHGVDVRNYFVLED